MCVSAVPTVVNAAEPYQGEWFETEEFKEFEAKKYDAAYGYWWDPLYSYTGYDDVEYLEFTQKLHDEFMLDPEESETNRLIYAFAKAFYDDEVERYTYCGNYHLLHDNFFGVAKINDQYVVYYIDDLSDVEVRVNPEEKDKYNFDYEEFLPKATEGQVVRPVIAFYEYSKLYHDNPYITEEEFNLLSFEEKLATIGKIYEEKGDVDWFYDVHGHAFGIDFYCDTKGKGYEIVDTSTGWKNGIEEINIVDGKIVSLYNTVDNADVLSTETLEGDANEDGKVSIADSVLIMQALSNPNEFALTEQGAINADYNGDGSVTTADALEIQLIDIS